MRGLIGAAGYAVAKWKNPQKLKASGGYQVNTATPAVIHQQSAFAAVHLTERATAP